LANRHQDHASSAEIRQKTQSTDSSLNIYVLLRFLALVDPGRANYESFAGVLHSSAASREHDAERVGEHSLAAGIASLR